jgi:hydrogenase expression/formation protein HypE
MGDHGLTVMAQRQSLSFVTDVQSDSAPLNRMAEELVRLGDIHVLRDPTRGGLATTLNEIASRSACAVTVREADIPVGENVRSACSLLGLDPLYLANEGKLICILPEDKAEAALDIMRASPYGKDAARIGAVLEPDMPLRPGQLVLETPIGGRRLLSMLEGDQLPRIC